MKRIGFTAVLLIITAIIMASCTSTPKNQTKDNPVEEVVESVPPQPEPKVGSEVPPDEYLAEEDSEIPEETPDALADAPEYNEPLVLAEAVEEPPMLAQTEPEPVIVPEPPPVIPEPPQIVAPPPEPPQVTLPAPSVPPPPIVSTPTAPAPQVPPPPPPPVAPPPPAPPAPVREEPPIIAWEPPPPPIPDLPNPTPAITGIQEAEMAFSRTVRATVGQLVVIPFRGTGWVYLGEAGAQRGIVYDSRRLDPEGQNFVFRTEAPGEYALKFYRQDFIRDFILNDYVKVIVGPPPETAGTGWFNPSMDRGRIIAEPRWPTSLAEAQALRSDTRPSPPDTSAPAETGTTATPSQPPSTPSSPPTTPTQPAVTPSSPSTPTQPPVTPSAPPATPVPVQPSATPSSPPAVPVNPANPPSAPLQAPVTPPPTVDPESYLEKAKEEFNAGRVASAISTLDQLRAYYPIESDETLWLYGQFYEANSPSRDILTSLGYYRRLMDEYPQSSRYDDARRRTAYLQRYYINIH